MTVAFSVQFSETFYKAGVHALNLPSSFAPQSHILISFSFFTSFKKTLFKMGTN